MIATLPTRIVSQESDYVGHWMEQSGAVAYRDGCVCIGLERDGELVAGTLYDHYNGASMFANVVITGQITRTWLHAIFHYPFVHLGVNVLIGLVAERNEKAMKFDQHLGFHKAYCIPDGDPTGSMWVMTMKREDCRFLRGHYEKL